MFDRIIDKLLFLWDQLCGKKIIRLRGRKKSRDDDSMGPFRLVRVLANRTNNRKRK